MANKRNVFLRFRRTHRMTQAELAAFMGVHQQTMSDWERAPARAPQWAREVCEDPMMSPAYLEQRIRRAKMEVLLSYGHTAAEAEDILAEQDMPFRDWRRARGLSQKQAAAALGIPEGTAKAYDWGQEIPEEIRERMAKYQ